MEENNKPVAVDKMETAVWNYESAGEKISLSFETVRKYLARGNGNLTNQEIVSFISMCKFQQLNPFLNEAYIVKFASSKGESTAQIITSAEAFMKRAENCANYDGMRSGIIVMRNGECVDLEGAFKLETDVLVGGWAEVYRSDRKFPFVSRVSMKEYNKGMSTWNAIPCTMIRKVAKMQALREAFPAQLGGMYVEDETKVVDTTYEEVHDNKVDEMANKKQLPPEQQANTSDTTGTLDMPDAFETV